MSLSVRHFWIIVLLALLLGLGLWLYPREGARAHHRALTSRELATRMLAEHLAKTKAGKRALVIGNPFTQEPGHPREIYDYEAAGIRGLHEGFGKAIVLSAIVFPPVRPEIRQNPAQMPPLPATTTPLSFLLTEDAFDRVWQAHSDCDLMISLIGLPAHLAAAQFWRRNDAPKLGLLLPDLHLIGDPTAVRTAFKSGKILAAVLNRPGAPPESAPLDLDPQAEFERRFLLVTPATIDALMVAWPQAF